MVSDILVHIWGQAQYGLKVARKVQAASLSRNAQPELVK